MNTPAGPNPYLRTKILTASPEELRLMLFDGALKFAKQARKALDRDKPEFDTVYENLTKAQKIVLELSTSMKAEVAPDLVEKLSGLYTYIYRRLVDANVEHEVGPLDEAIKLLAFERETWVLLMEKNAAERGTPAPTAPTSQQAAISAYSQSA